jgi:exopolysaccharide biosynthesis polyprenyl glycosylphosphotransferase
MLRRFSVNFALLSMLIDMLVVVASMGLAASIRPALNGISIIKPMPEGVGLPLPLYGLFPCITVIIFSSFALYDGKKFLRAVDEFSALTLAFMVLSIGLAGILYLSFRDVSRALFVLFILIAYCGFLLWRALARGYFRWRKEWLEEGARRVLVVGTGQLGQEVCDHVSRHAVENLRVVGYLVDDERAAIKGVEILGKADDIEQIVHQHSVTDVVLALPHSAYQNLARIVSSLESTPVRIWVALGFFDLALYRLEVADMAGIPMLDLRAPALSEYQLQVKRAFDLVLGIIALVFVLPLMIILALAIWLQDRGPVIFKQPRVGENGRLFTIYKFRTMVLNAEQLSDAVALRDENGNLIHKTRSDPRVTPIGHILRRFSLDELPQLFNVLQGSMSLVGPRPELPYLVEKYQPWQRKRFTVPPGITGWWQITGRSDRPMHLNTEDDLYYIQNYSLMLDIVILMRTAWAVIIGRGSF